MPTGYNDYQRISYAGGYLLGYNAAPITGAGTVIFQGNVSAWPYINVFWNCVSGTDFYQVQVIYFTDNTFTTQVAQNTFNRSGNMVAWRQLVTLSPWALIQIIPKVGTSNASVEFAAYGTTQTSSPGKLAARGGPAYSRYRMSMGAASTFSEQFITTCPGLNYVTLDWEASNNWDMHFDYYDFGSGAYKSYMHWQHSSFGNALNTQMSFPDTPIQVFYRNDDSVGNFVTLCIIPVDS